MHEYVAISLIIIAVPAAIFAAMMSVAAIALYGHGESVRLVLDMPRAFFRNRGAYLLLPMDPPASDAVGITESHSARILSINSDVSHTHGR